MVASGVGLSGGAVKLAVLSTILLKKHQLSKKSTKIMSREERI